MHDPIAYTYDADYHCPQCADSAGMLTDGAVDSDGNEPYPVAPWDEWFEASTLTRDTLACSDCGAVLDVADPDDSTYLDAMTTAYVEASLWAGLDWSRVDTPPLDENYTAGDVAPGTLEAIREDCASFLDETRDDLLTLEPEAAGQDFYLTRNNHGAGFWDRDLGERGDRLTKAAHAYGESDLYRGDDGRLYVS